MTRLRTIPVLFNQEEHTYTNTETGEIYRGITGTLIHRLFPNKYTGIPQHILDNAALRGSMVHEDIELTETLGVVPSTEEGRQYLRLKKEHGLKFLQSEYTVSDLEHYATNIDAIYDVEENLVDLADFKTTAKLDTESLSWQLSICAYMLEKNNPHVKVRRLLGIWLRGDIAQIIEVERRTDAEIEALMKADQDDTSFAYERKLPDYITENMATLYTLGKKIKELTAEYDAVKGEVLEKMAEHNDKSFDTGCVLITRQAAGKRTSFDSARFKQEHADMYEQYMKETETKDLLKLTIR